VFGALGIRHQAEGGKPLADQDYVKVASLDKLPPGEMMRVDIGRHEILLVNVDGKVHACSNICSHQFQQLSFGDLDGEEVCCSLHGATFNVVTGEQLPGKYAEFGPIPVYEVRLDGSDILVKRPP
jgi:3-phenylpropionate/trans-cinnamate dioxygenase ferredoxin subunit